MTDTRKNGGFTLTSLVKDVLRFQCNTGRVALLAGFAVAHYVIISVIKSKYELPLCGNIFVPLN